MRENFYSLMFSFLIFPFLINNATLVLKCDLFPLKTFSFSNAVH